MTDVAWIKLNKKSITYIKMVQDGCIRWNISWSEGFHNFFWGMGEAKITTPINQVRLILQKVQLDEHLMSQKVVYATWWVKKCSWALIYLCRGTLKLQDSGLPPFNDKLKAIFLLMTLPNSWETLVVSLSNNDVRGSIVNEEIRRKFDGEGSGSTNVARGRTEKKSENVQRNRSWSKGKAKVTCYQCGRKGHKKRDFFFLERFSSIVLKRLKTTS